MNLFIILQELKSKSEKIAELQQKMVFISDQLQSYKKTLKNSSISISNLIHL